jgi:cell division protein FtsB
MRKLTLILVLLLLVLQYQLWFSHNSLIDMWRLQRQLDAQKFENEQLKERNRALEAEVKDLKQGLEAIEERSRSELGMIRKGETFYQIVEDSPKPEE